MRSVPRTLTPADSHPSETRLIYSGPRSANFSIHRRKYMRIINFPQGPEVIPFELPESVPALVNQDWLVPFRVSLAILQLCWHLTPLTTWTPTLTWLWPLSVTVIIMDDHTPCLYMFLRSLSILWPTCHCLTYMSGIIPLNSLGIYHTYIAIYLPPSFICLPNIWPFNNLMARQKGTLLF